MSTTTAPAAWQRIFSATTTTTAHATRTRSTRTAACGVNLAGEMTVPATSSDAHCLACLHATEAAAAATRAAAQNAAIYFPAR